MTTPSEGGGERVIGAIAMLWTALAPPDTADVRRVKVETFRRALDGLPVWTIEAAADRWLRDDVAEWCPGADTAFPPRPPELRRIAAGLWGRVRMERDRLVKLLAAKVEPPPADLERRRAQVAKILPAFRAAMRGEPEPCDPTPAERAEKLSAWAKQIGDQPA